MSAVVPKQHLKYFNCLHTLYCEMHILYVERKFSKPPALLIPDLPACHPAAATHPRGLAYTVL